MKSIYLDNAATTKLAPEVSEAMIPVLCEVFGNPSSTHAVGRKAKALIETSRRDIAKLLGCEPRSITFTSGGTEADNLALRAAVRDLGCMRIVTSAAEHSAVIASAEKMAELFGVEIVHVAHHHDGTVDCENLRSILATGPLTLVSLMHANNEVGVIQPLDKISQACKEVGAYFHSDTVQTMAHYHFQLDALQIDFLTCSAHKFHGPKGTGFLYTHPRNKIKSQIVGGGQERGLRSGTENLHGIVGLGAALKLSYDGLDKHSTHIRSIKKRMVDGLMNIDSDIVFNAESDKESRLYTVLSVKFPPHPNSGMALFLLDLEGVACSGGSACSSGATTGSHVLNALGYHDPNRASLRFSFSRYTTNEDIDYALGAISRVFALVES
ncbi:MAG TPA: cysteine desulfurase [Flavobacteriales bacterium]|nr:cysteine desulfurase [Flavobacteriales bacterium]HIO60168.1 cysteine desulfurase [Flavobacteriales bacterium]